MNLNSKTLALLGAFALVSIPLAVTAADDGTPNASNKPAVAGSGVEYLGPATSSDADGDDSDSTTEDIITTSIKTSPGEDLLIAVTLECSIWTTVTTIGNDAAEATATVKVWVEIDGVPVSVAADDPTDDGKVVFCDRTHRQTTTDFDDEDAKLETYQRTRSANAFNWIATDLAGGSQPQEIVVRAELSGETTGTALAQAGIGHRTLTIEPVKLIRGDTV